MCWLSNAGTKVVHPLRGLNPVAENIAQKRDNTFVRISAPSELEECDERSLD